MIAPGCLSHDRSSMDSVTWSMARFLRSIRWQMSLVPHPEEWAQCDLLERRDSPIVAASSLRRAPHAAFQSWFLQH